MAKADHNLSVWSSLLQDLPPVQHAEAQWDMPHGAEIVEFMRFDPRPGGGWSSTGIHATDGNLAGRLYRIAFWDDLTMRSTLMTYITRKDLEEHATRLGCSGSWKTGDKIPPMDNPYDYLRRP